MASLVDFQSSFSKVPVCEENINFGVFVNTNEGKSKETLEEASKYPVLAGKVLLFTSGFFGLDLASARGKNSGSESRIEYVVCVDNNPNVERFWRGISQILVDSSSRIQAIDKIASFLLANNKVISPKSHYFVGYEILSSYSFTRTMVFRIKKDIMEGKSWLSSDESFDHIKSIFAGRKFVFIRADLSEKEVTGTIAKTLRAQGLFLDCIYMSNVCEYTEHYSNIEKFRSAMDQFKLSSKEDTYFVDTEPRASGGNVHHHEPLKMCIRKGFFETKVEQMFVASPSCKEYHSSKRSQ